MAKWILDVIRANVGICVSNRQLPLIARVVGDAFPIPVACESVNNVLDVRVLRVEARVANVDLVFVGRVRFSISALWIEAFIEDVGVTLASAVWFGMWFFRGEAWVVPYNERLSERICNSALAAGFKMFSMFLLFL